MFENFHAYILFEKKLIKVSIKKLEKKGRWSSKFEKKK